ncbi:hypothetical protein LCGC14_2143810, partial [marine sediment metagenome]
MSRLSLWAGLTALALAAIVYAACSGASSQEAIPTPSPSQVFSSEESGPPQVEAGAPIGEPTVERANPKPKPGEAEVIYIGPRDVKAVALTFDTGVHAGRVPEVLDILKEHGTAATFGITGEWAVTNPDLLKRIVDEGHAVINHSWSHASFTGEDTDTEPLTADQMRDELRRTEEKILEIISEQVGLPMVDLSDVKIDVETLRALPPKLVFRRGLLPLQKHNGTLRLVTSDPFDLYSFDEVRMLTGLEIQPVLAPRAEIDKVIKAHYGVGGETIDEMMMSTDDVEVLRDLSSDSEDKLAKAKASHIKEVDGLI